MKNLELKNNIRVFIQVFAVLMIILFINIDVYADAPDILWTKTYGGVECEYGYSVQQTDDNGYIIAGYTMSFGAGGDDVYLIKTNINGDILWTQTKSGVYKYDKCFKINRSSFRRDRFDY